MSLYDEFIISLQNLSPEQLFENVKKAREDSKNSYLLDAFIIDNQQTQYPSFEIDPPSFVYTGDNLEKGSEYSRSITKTISPGGTNRMASTEDGTESYSVSMKWKGIKDAA